MNKAKRLIILIVIIIMLVVIFIIANNILNNDYSLDNSVVNNYAIREESNYEKYLKERDESTYEEMGRFFENTTNEICIYVNGEEITKKEIALTNFSNNNNYIKNYTNVNQLKSYVDPIQKIVQEFVICQEAEILGITFTEKDVEKIKSVPNYEEDIKEISKSVNMSYDECEEMYIESEKRFYLVSKWQEYIIPKLNNGEINIDNKEFNEKYKAYKLSVENSELSNSIDIALELLELYKQYLVSQANIEYLE